MKQPSAVKTQDARWEHDWRGGSGVAGVTSPARPRTVVARSRGAAPDNDVTMEFAGLFSPPPVVFRS